MPLRGALEDRCYALLRERRPPAGRAERVLSAPACSFPPGTPAQVLAERRDVRQAVTLSPCRWKQEVRCVVASG